MSFVQMSKTVSVRLPGYLADWLSHTARRTSVPRSRIIRQELENARDSAKPPVLRLAGAVAGRADLSAYTGFSRRASKKCTLGPICYCLPAPPAPPAGRESASLPAEESGRGEERLEAQGIGCRARIRRCATPSHLWCPPLVVRTAQDPLE
jgi:predicted transcriptional regulator